MERWDPGFNVVAMRFAMKISTTIEICHDDCYEIGRESAGSVRGNNKNQGRCFILTDGIGRLRGERC